MVSFALDRMGHVLSSSIVKGSGDAAFDEAALAMVRRSDPVPQPPPLVADEGLSFTLPVIFRVKSEGLTGRKRRHFLPQGGLAKRNPPMKTRWWITLR